MEEINNGLSEGFDSAQNGCEHILNTEQMDTFNPISRIVDLLDSIVLEEKNELAISFDESINEFRPTSVCIVIPEKFHKPELLGNNSDGDYHKVEDKVKIRITGFNDLFHKHRKMSASDQTVYVPNLLIPPDIKAAGDIARTGFRVVNELSVKPPFILYMNYWPLFSSVKTLIDTEWCSRIVIVGRPTHYFNGHPMIETDFYNLNQYIANGKIILNK